MVFSEHSENLHYTSSQDSLVHNSSLFVFHLGKLGGEGGGRKEGLQDQLSHFLPMFSIPSLTISVSVSIKADSKELGTKYD